MVKEFNFIWALLLAILWGLAFKVIDPSMTVFQTATLGLLTGIFFLLSGSKE